MNLAAGFPSQWLVTLHDGSVIEVWADSVEGLAGPEDQRDYLFGNLMDIRPEDQKGFDVTARPNLLDLGEDSACADLG